MFRSGKISKYFTNRSVNLHSLADISHDDLRKERG
jgi:hypothetical protein